MLPNLWCDRRWQDFTVCDGCFRHVSHWSDITTSLLLVPLTVRAFQPFSPLFEPLTSSPTCFILNPKCQELHLTSASMWWPSDPWDPPLCGYCNLATRHRYCYMATPAVSFTDVERGVIPQLLCHLAASFTFLREFYFSARRTQEAEHFLHDNAEHISHEHHPVKSSVSVGFLGVPGSSMVAQIPAVVPDTVMAVYSSVAPQGPASKHVVVPETVTSSLFSRLGV